MSRKCGERNKILGIFSKKPLVYLHYVLLLGILYLALVINNSYIGNLNLIFTIIWFYLALSIGDMLIHKILGID